MKTKKQKQVTKPETAAYNHGFCFAVTYSARNSININDLDQRAGFYYDKPAQVSMFKAGYLVALDELNVGRIKACELGANANAEAQS
jgi:hypothetical protein